MERSPVLVAPSLLAANFLDLGKDIDMVNRSEADWFHLDVMDGRFVPNISFGLPVIAQIKKAARKPCDVHLMIEEPEKYAADFQQAGADILTVHAEACIHLHRNIQQIKGLGMKAGVALNPHTPVVVLENVIRDIDVVLIMSVNPGFGGQTFIGQSYHKIRQLSQLIKDTNAHALIEVDGGISPDNAANLIQAGANVLVAGSAVFSSPEPEKTIAAIKRGGR
ncbi:ribulose-phosphate 3-epimerase [Chitinophaga solisilvae]|uniref:Ribulose-phosphate 3-epimerase n=1 Tax=Chitinophaga solisilvae TaxID=1233460 RepID=A0A433WJK5_9BACT|nr:ribulose-phosphate 3-epimerase [Chitinophaga solisilvae]NSL87499.1 ribulose-phosphate 3-epimerase [Chitinophaga solisilvae]